MAGLGRLVFLGTGAFAVPVLQAIAPLADDLLVVTQPDRRAGRGMRLRSSPVASWAQSAGFQVATPERLRSDEGREIVRGFHPNGMLLAAYGQLVPGDLLSMGDRPPLNVHPSLLPRHRGAAPIAAAILAGDTETGVTLMVMTERLDAGPIVAQWRVPLRGDEATPALESRLADLAAEAVPTLLRDWAAGDLPSKPQDEALATYSGAFRREDGVIDWTDAAAAIDRRVRALQPWPGAWTTLGGRRLHVRAARPAVSHPGSTSLAAGTVVASDSSVVVACGDGSLDLVRVQPEGRGPMSASDWLRGVRDAGRGGLRLGESVEEP